MRRTAFRVPAMSAVLALCVGTAASQSPYERMLESHRMVMDRLTVQARTLTDRAADEMETVRGWESVRDERRREMRSMLGLDPWPEKTPLRLQITRHLVCLPVEHRLKPVLDAPEEAVGVFHDPSIG